VLDDTNWHPIITSVVQPETKLTWHDADEEEKKTTVIKLRLKQIIRFRLQCFCIHGWDVLSIRNNIYIAGKSWQFLLKCSKHTAEPLAILLSFMYMAEWFRFFIINKTK
jgi:hypothetical protein